MAERSLGIFEKYDFEVLNQKKGRGIVVLFTDKGLKVLKEYNGSGKNIDETAAILEELNKSSHIKTDVYVKNLEGEYITPGADGNRYIIKEWYECRDCDIRNTADLYLLMNVLAGLHLELEKLSKNEYKYEAAMPSTLMQRHTRELLRIRKYLLKRSDKNSFERMALKNMDNFIAEAYSAEEMCRSFEKEEKLCTGLCHGNYNYHNISMAKEYCVVMNFEKMHRGYIMMDVYNVMRKLLEKYDWNIRLGHQLLSEYNKVKTISSEDVEFLAILFSYPEKFWKVLNSYYNSKKTWMPPKSSVKLNNVLNQNRLRLEFINTIKN